MHLSEQLRSAWTAFAGTGDPGWPAFDTGATRIVDPDWRVGDYPERFSRELWAEPPAALDLQAS